GTGQLAGATEKFTICPMTTDSRRDKSVGGLEDADGRRTGASKDGEPVRKLMHQLADQMDAIVGAEHRARLGGAGAGEPVSPAGRGSESGLPDMQPHATRAIVRRKR